MKRVVSFVPSWTETLIEVGADVVGRTRFCIHPADSVKTIEAVGGTKSFDESKLRSLKPDLILLDREENTREMFEIAQTVAPTLVSHVEHVRDMPRELRALAKALETKEIVSALEDLARRFELVLATPAPASLHNDSFPGLLRWLKRDQSSTEYVYVIWKDPWMVVRKDTFIGSMLERVGIDLANGEAGALLSASATKYPKLDELPARATVLLSSEPYPFTKKFANEPPELPNPSIALVDGESFSWFGVRALRFLESLKS